jgi:hypothetical protein
MPQILIPVDENDVPAARDRLSREVEQLELTATRGIKIHYPSRFADELKIGVVGDAGRYQGHPAFVRDDVPYTILIEHED